MGCAFAAAAPPSHATHYRINALVKHSRQPLRTGLAGAPAHDGEEPRAGTVAAQSGIVMRFFKFARSATECEDIIAA